MKKKIYFIISSILQMISAIYILSIANEVFENSIKAIKNVYSAFPIEFQNRVMGMLDNFGIYFIIVPTIICIIANIIILILSFGNYIEKKKTVLIFLSIICIIFGSTTVSTLLAIVNFIILLSIKKETNNRVQEKNKNVMEIDKNKKYTNKDLLYGAIILISYFSQFILSNILPENNKIISGLIAILFYITIFVIVFVFFGDKIISDFKLLKKSFSSYLEYDLPKYGLMFITFIFINLMCIMITKNSTSVNQQAVESLPKILLIILSVFWAPIVEETVFRGTIRRFIKNNVVYILISSILFGFMHAINEATVFNMIITTIPYATLGGFLAYIYMKTNNIANNMMIHAIWNLFAVIMSLAASIILL